VTDASDTSAGTAPAPSADATADGPTAAAASPVIDQTADQTAEQAANQVADHPAVARVRAVLAAQDAQGRIVVLDEHARTASAAAEQLGVTVAQIANSLIFAVPDDDGGRRALLVLTSGAHRVDTAKVAALVGVPRLDRAGADFVREQTGFAIGGVAPVGHAHPVQTLVDTALADHDEVWAAAGHPRTVFPTSFTELVRITGGTPADVA
jgi:prolyl-tRNA editing enzyme YbaK/EbsC (Cys-tRNA(Pro) deacylase)